jgi:hypothetical protein
VVATWEKAREARRAAGAKLPDFQNIRQKNMGLSYARNAGAYSSTGEVIAYTDSDCMADPDWLYYLMGTLISGDYAGVGGPNISPPAQDWIQACVAAAPGGPSHVLLTDVVAEHIPGCNMAFHRWAFDAAGGFDPDYRKAGDDVDFCWRLQQSGQVVAFTLTHPPDIARAADQEACRRRSHRDLLAGDALDVAQNGALVTSSSAAVTVTVTPGSCSPSLDSTSRATPRVSSTASAAPRAAWCPSAPSPPLCCCRRSKDSTSFWTESMHPCSM